MSAPFRAAWLGDTILTAPEHATLADADLLAEARAFLNEQHPQDDDEPCVPRGCIRIVEVHA